MVTKPDPPNKPTGIQPLKKMPDIEPAKPVSGFAGVSAPPKTPEQDKTQAFKLPDSVSPSEIKENSYRYGGGRSAGKLSTKP